MPTENYGRQIRSKAEAVSNSIEQLAACSGRYRCEGVYGGDWHSPQFKLSRSRCSARFQILKGLESCNLANHFSLTALAAAFFGLDASLFAASADTPKTDSFSTLEGPVTGAW